MSSGFSQVEVRQQEAVGMLGRDGRNGTGRIRSEQPIAVNLEDLGHGSCVDCSR